MVLVERVLFLKFADVIGLSLPCRPPPHFEVATFYKVRVFEGWRISHLDCMRLTYELDSFPLLRHADSIR